MSKEKKRTLALLLTALLCLLAATAMAAGTLTLPKSMKEIKSEAFEGNISLDEVVLPEGIETIGSRAFADSSVASINLPDSISFIADDAFEGCADFDVTAEQGSYAYGWAVSAGLIRPETPASSFAYEIKNGEVAITAFIGDETEIVVPAKIGEYPVTSLADYSLAGNSQITSIELPDTIAYIGKYVFDRWSGLETFKVPSGVVSIGFAAFHDCTNLKDILVDGKNSAFASKDGVLFTAGMEELVCYPAGKSAAMYVLPDSVKTIRKMAFRSSFALTGIWIPASVTSIEVYAFDNCSNLKDIQIDQNNTAYYTADGVVFDQREQELVCYPNGKQETSYQIPEGTKSIAPSAFAYCDQLREITIPNGVTFIGDGAFEGCASLEGISIPEGVTSIEDATFLDCSSLTYVEIPDTVTELGLVLFGGCDSLTSVEIPASVTSIDEHSFTSCTATIYVVKDSYAHTFCEKYGVDYKVIGSVDGEGITEDGFGYEIINGEVTISEYTGEELDVVVPEMIEDCPVRIIDDSAFEYSGITSIVLPETVRLIGVYSLSDCDSLESIILPEGLEHIGYGAFWGCDVLTKVYIPESVTVIEEEVFYDCPDDLILYGIEGSYAEIYAEENHFTFVTEETPEQEQNYPLVNGFKVNGVSSNLDAYIGDTLTFEGMVTAPEGVLLDEIHICFAAYEDTAVTTYLLLEDVGVNQYDLADIPPMVVGETYNGKTMDVGSNYLIGVLATDENGNSLNDPPYLWVYIGQQFYEEGNYTYLLVEGGCVIDEYCGNEIEVEIPNTLGGHRVLEIGSKAFNYEKAEAIWLPEGITTINSHAFFDCKYLSLIFIPESVTYIATNAFSGLQNEWLTICGETDSYAQEYAEKKGIEFFDVGTLFGVQIESLNINGEDGELQIAMGEVFSLGGMVTSLYSDLDTVEVWVWDQLAGHLLAKAEGIEASSYDLAELGEFVIDETYEAGQEHEVRVKAKSIEGAEDEGSIKLVIEPTEPEIETKYTEDGLAYVVENDIVKIAGYIGSASEVEIPAEIDGHSVTGIDQYAFDGCTQITSVVIPDTVETIGYYAFHDCSNLKEVTVPDSVSSIMDGAFWECTALESIHIPEGLTSLPYGVLYGCSSL